MEYQTKEDGSIHQFMVKVEGKSFACEECYCNVFHKPLHDDTQFICNGCGTQYRGEGEEKIDGTSKTN